MKSFLYAAWLVVSCVFVRAEKVPHTLDLRECFTLALEHSPSLRSASAQFLSAEGRAYQLHAILYPTVNAQGLSTPLVFYVQIQEVFYSRATLPQLRLSRLTREQAYLNYRQVLVDLEFQVRQAFTNALGAQTAAELTRELIKSRKEAYAKGQQLFDAGHLQRSDVTPLKVLAGLAGQSSATAELTQQQGILALAQVIGVDLPDDEELIGSLDDRGPGQFNVAALAAQALREREDLKLLVNAKLSSDQQIQIDLKNLYPEVGFVSDSAIQPPSFLPGGATAFDLERNFNEPETQRQSGNTQLPLSLYFNWLLFDGGNLSGVRAADKSQLATQAEAIAALRRAIPGEIADAVAQVESARATLRTLAKQLPSGELEKDANIDYEAGRVRLLDKVNFETDIMQQRQLRLESQVRLNLALAALDHALGRGLEARRTSLAQ